MYCRYYSLKIDRISRTQPPDSSRRYRSTRWEEILDGASFDGTDYWCSSYLQNTVFRLTTAGSVISSFPQSYTYGLTWDGRYLWTSDCVSSGQMIRRHTTAGSVVSSFSVPSQISLGCDLGWDGVYLWCPDIRGYVYRLTTTGSVAASYLRVSCFPGSGPWNIYTIDIGPAPAVTPASFGQVKALYR